MKEKDKLEAVVTISCSNEKVCAEIRKMLAGLEGVESFITVQQKDEAFRPKDGDICVSLNDEGDPEYIFKANGECSQDDGKDWLEATVSVEFSGNILTPYMVVTGEGQLFLAESCREATAAERELYTKVVKEPEEEENAPWKIGELVHIVCAETGCSKVFYVAPMFYADTKMMENRVKRGWVFKTEEECQALCDKLNEAIQKLDL